MASLAFQSKQETHNGMQVGKEGFGLQALSCVSTFSLQVTPNPLSLLWKDSSSVTKYPGSLGHVHAVTRQEGIGVYTCLFSGLSDRLVTAVTATGGMWLGSKMGLPSTKRLL